ncbi:hypothetical protein AVEN_160753-1 [Araneus ventricosus]|uniref:Uncharacterized protein n=1 Tax=Araneus ventricosus TaxID=182803 RepID=A0A4Y2GCP0_ARAVE|nr:hypothetical protein AVEN_160753-1 [Araneus ventricosus]
MQENQVSQVAGTIPLIQISNRNRQQFTSNNSNSTFGFRSTNSQQITNNNSKSTFNSAKLTGFPALTADETPKSSQWINILRARTHAVVTAKSAESWKWCSSSYSLLQGGAAYSAFAPTFGVNHSAGE